jgi:hypothetical protein
VGRALAERIAEPVPVRVPSQRAAEEARPSVAVPPLHPMLRLQRALGNGAVAGMVQARRRVGDSDDLLEREADDVARQVTTTPAARCACGGTIGPTGECDRCRARRIARETGGVQRRTTEAVAPLRVPLATPAVERTLRAGGGEPLDRDTCGEMERAFGRDFGGVRVHNDVDAARSAASIDALAYTAGSDIVFGAGQYAPRSDSGRRLLAHELTHVVQQGGDSGASAWGALQRQPNSATGTAAARAATIADMATLEQLMLRLFSMLDEATRATVVRNKTVAIGLVLNSEGEAHLVYATNNNWINRSLREVADALGLARFDPHPQAEGRGAVGAPGDAEQILLSWTDVMDGDVLGMAVSRPLCPDCQLAVSHYESGEIPVVEVSIPQPSTGGAAVGGGAGPRRGGVEPPGTTESIQVNTRFRVLESETIPGGRTVLQVETVLAEGLEELNVHVRSRGGTAIPERITLRITTDAQGALIGAESATGEASVLANALAQQAVHSAPGTAASGGEVSGMEGGIGDPAGGVAARGASRLMRGIAWGGLALFVGATIYNVATAKASERPQVAGRAAGGFAGGWVAGYVVCNLVLGIETLGWSLLICGFVAGIPGGLAGEAVADVLYEEATIDDDEIRSWVAGHDLNALGLLPVAEKLRLIFSMMKGWVSDDDIAAIVRILQSVTSGAEMGRLREQLRPQLLYLSSVGQRTEIRVALARRVAD